MASGVWFVLTSGAMATEITPAVRSEIAPSGKLRVGLNHGNFLLVTPGSSATDPRGVASDVARELGRRVGVPVEFIKFDTAGKLGDGVKTGAWDVAFLGAEPQRAAEIAFTAAYLEIPSTYIVPAGSPIRSVDEVDRAGVRIAVADQSAYGLYLAAVHFADKWSGNELDSAVGFFFPLTFVFYFFYPFGYYDEGGPTRGHDWAPSLTYAVLGFILVALGLVLAWRGRAETTAAGTT